MKKAFFRGPARLLSCRAYGKIARVLVLPLLILVLSTCQSLGGVVSDPVVSLHTAGITGFSIVEAEVLCVVRVENPNPFDIPFPEIGWELYINDNFFISGVIRNNQNIRARNYTLIEIPVNLNYLDIINTFISFRGRRDVDYKVALTANFSLPLLRDREWRLEYDGALQLPQLPRISSPSMRVDSLDITGAQIAVSVNIENPNNFPLPTPKFNIDYLVNGNSFVTGAMEGRGPIAPSGSSAIVFGFPVRFLDLLRRFQNLGNLREAPTMLNLSFDFGIPVFANEPYVLQIPGTLPLR